MASFQNLPLPCLFKLLPFLFPPFHAADEVNVLRQWKAKDKDALKNLLDFLKRICKEKERAHIVLASSDFFMVSWLKASKSLAIQKYFPTWKLLVNL